MILDLFILLKLLLYIVITDNNMANIWVIIVIGGISIGLIMITRYKNSKEGKNRYYIELLIYILFSILLFINSLIYNIFHIIPSIRLLEDMNRISIWRESIFKISNLISLILLLDILIIIYDYLKYNGSKIDRKIIDFNMDKRYRDIGIFFLLSSIILGVNIKSLDSSQLYPYDNKYLSADIFKENNRFSDKEIKDIIDRSKLENGKFTGIGKDKNLIVIQVEALQDFVIDLEYNGIEITPNLNRLIADQSSIYYDQYYQLVGRGNTSDAEFVSHNSLYPAMDKASYEKYADKNLYPLPKLLKEKGYNTAAFHGYKKEFWNRENAYKKQGFDRYNSMDFYKDYKTIGMGVSDKDFFHQSLEELERLNKKDNPFYSFMITLTSHAPFKMPDKYNIIPLKEEHIDTTLGDYIQSIHYVDKEIGRFIEGLKEKDIYDDTIIAIYGDHFALSSAHKEHRIVMNDFYGFEYEPDEMMHIPLIIHIPNSKQGETINNLGSHLDFYPTILNILGYKNNKGIMFGRDISNYSGKNFVAPQTYMAKGSVILEDSVFEISRDGLFKNSRAYNKSTKQTMDIEEFRNIYNMVIDEINLSDYLINSNILEEYIDTGKIENKQIEKEYIKINELDLKNDSLNNLDRYKNEELLVNISKKDKILVIEDGDKNSINRLLDKAKKNNIRLLFKADRDEEELLIRLYDEYKIENHWAVIKEFKSYLNLYNNRYEKILFIENNRYKTGEILEFLNRNPDIGIITKDNSKIKNIIKDKIYLK